MSRIGTCLQCGQRYGDIPDSVTATRVKCKVCGGAVEIPPLAVPAAAPAPPMQPPVAAAPLVPPPAAQPVVPAAQPVVPPQPAKPVIEARPAPIAPRPVAPAKAAGAPATAVPTRPIFAPKKAVVPPPARPVQPPPAAKPVAPAPAVPPAKPTQAVPPMTPKPAPKPAAPAAAKPAPVPMQPAPAPVRPVAPAAPPAPSRPSAAEILAAAKAKREAAAQPPPPSAKPSAAEVLAAAKAKREAQTAASAPPTQKASARAAAAPRPAAEPAAKRERREPVRAKSGSKGPLLLTGALVLVTAGAGGLFFMMQKSQPVEPEPAPATVMQPPAVVQAPAAGSGDVAASKPAPAAGSGSAPNPAAEQAPSAPSQDAAPPAPPVEDAPKRPAGAPYTWATPEAGKPIPLPTGAVDPALITLELAPPLERWVKTDDKIWSDIQSDLGLFLENSGARSNRAGDALVKAGRHAYPALVMGMMKQDWTTNDGVKAAGALNDLIAKIDAATNFTWRSVERYEVGSDKWKEDVTILKKGAIQRYNRWVSVLRSNDGEWDAIAKKGGSTGNTVIDEEGNQVGDVPPDLPPDAPPDGR